MFPNYEAFDPIEWTTEDMKIHPSSLALTCLWLPLLVVGKTGAAETAPPPHPASVDFGQVMQQAQENAITNLRQGSGQAAVTVSESVQTAGESARATKKTAYECLFWFKQRASRSDRFDRRGDRTERVEAHIDDGEKSFHYFSGNSLEIGPSGAGDKYFHRLHGLDFHPETFIYEHNVPLYQTAAYIVKHFQNVEFTADGPFLTLTASRDASLSNPNRLAEFTCKLNLEAGMRIESYRFAFGADDVGSFQKSAAEFVYDSQRDFYPSKMHLRLEELFNADDGRLDNHLVKEINIQIIRMDSGDVADSVFDAASLGVPNGALVRERDRQRAYAYRTSSLGEEILAELSAGPDEKVVDKPIAGKASSH